MAKEAIEKLEKDGVLELDDKERVRIVNNLLVSIVSEKSTQPVINNGFSLVVVQNEGYYTLLFSPFLVLNTP